MISPGSPLALGSASPRRRDLLEGLGIPLAVVPVDADERHRAGENPAAYLERVVLDKLALVVADPRAERATVALVADTIVLLGDRILGKPADSTDARSMLAQLSGRTHEVRTRFALGTPSARAGAVHAETVSTRVTFRPLDDVEIERYVATGEGTDKAGSYAIQGLGSFAVSRIEGSYANVVGLPVCEVVLALKQLGLLGAFP